MSLSILTLTADTAYSLGSPTAGTVTIVSDDLPPDLVVSSVTAPSTAGANVDIVVTDTTKNQGTGSSLPSKTGFYLSTNLSLDGTDVLACQPSGDLAWPRRHESGLNHRAHSAVDGCGVVLRPRKSGLGRRGH